jgi:hypothetical protein
MAVMFTVVKLLVTRDVFNEVMLFSVAKIVNQDSKKKLLGSCLPV